MSRRSSLFTQSDVARALKGATRAGLKVARAEIDPQGKINLIFADGGEAAVEASDFEVWKARHAR
jgi:hypothetical protein